MPDFLRQTFSSDVNVVWTDVVLRQILALLFGSAVAGVYALTRGYGPERKSIITTLVLLTILIGTISSVIGDNVARAFSLVGALSIVRFRTVVEDTRDTAFVILAVAVGMAVGSGYLIAPLAVIPTALVAALAFGGRPAPKGTEYAVTVRTTLGVPEDATLEALRRHSSRVEIHRVATARQGSAMETEYRVTLDTGPRALHDQLSSLPGVVGVEIQAT